MPSPFLNYRTPPTFLLPGTKVDAPNLGLSGGTVVGRPQQDLDVIEAAEDVVLVDFGISGVQLVKTILCAIAAVTSVIALTAASIAAPAPIIGSPAVSIAGGLNATSIIVPVPIIGSPVIVPS